VTKAIAYNSSILITHVKSFIVRVTGVLSPRLFQ